MNTDSPKKHIITLGGYPGSGKSTTRRLLSERLGYKTFSTGDYVREMAIERGMTLEAFNELVASAKDIEEAIDARLVHIETHENEYIVDSHLGFHFIPSAFSVFLDISLETAAHRIFGDKHTEIRIKSGDTMETLDEAMERTQKRIDNHRDRYSRHYGIDPYVRTQYDYVVNSELLTPAECVEDILVAYTTWLGA
jgi:CMP/dCMP kinase